MADRYANQEEAMAIERDDRLHQKDKKDKRDIPESSKPKDHKQLKAAGRHGLLALTTSGSSWSLPVPSILRASTQRRTAMP